MILKIIRADQKRVSVTEGVFNICIRRPLSADKLMCLEIKDGSGESTVSLSNGDVIVTLNEHTNAVISSTEIRDRKVVERIQ